MIRVYRYAKYEQRLIFPAGKYLMDLNGASRQQVRELLPWFKNADEMGIRIAFKNKLRALNGKFADEVHDFQNVRQGGMQLLQILMKDGHVIELAIH